MIAKDTESRDLEKRQKDQALINAYHRVFGTTDGKAVLADLCAKFRADDPVFFPVGKGAYSAYDAITAALTDGGRTVLIYIRKNLAADAEGDANLKPKTKVRK